MHPNYLTRINLVKQPEENEVKQRTFLNPDTLRLFLVLANCRVKILPLPCFNLTWLKSNIPRIVLLIFSILYIYIYISKLNLSLYIDLWCYRIFKIRLAIFITIYVLTNNFINLLIFPQTVNIYFESFILFVLISMASNSLI